MDHINKYEDLWCEWYLTEFIGQGSRGSVYRYNHIVISSCSCAIKLITLRKDQLGLPASQKLSADELWNRQRQAAIKNIREIELMNTLGTEANIAPIYDYDICSNTNTIDILLHMKLFTSLSSLMKTDTLNRSEIIRIGIDLCNALISCEKYKVIHCNLKPDNIFRDAEGNYRLGDFVLSRQIPERTSVSLRSFCNTPLYLAPEALNWGEEISYKTDQYALGIVLYQLLNNGKTPFCENMDDPLAQEESIQKKLAGEELPPPANENGELWKIIRRACEPEQANRYSCAAEMKQALLKLLEDSKTASKF